MFSLHTHGTENGIVAFLEEVMLHGLLDTAIVIPFLFITYLFMEFIEHRASERTLGFMKKAGGVGPLIGGLVGAVPQCAFSAVAANLYTGRVITLGTLLSVFLSTSDEMLPLLIGSGVGLGNIFKIVLYKVAVAIAVGFIVDILIKFLAGGKREIKIDEICEEDNCHCERGIFYSAIHHTVTTTLLVFAVTLIINTLIFFIGSEALSEIVGTVPALSHLLAALIGIIPGCAGSVALSTLGIKGVITTGAMLSGLFPGAGVGLVILLRFNKSKKENLLIIATLVVIGFIFGLIADAIGLSIL